MVLRSTFWRLMSDNHIMKPMIYLSLKRPAICHPFYFCALQSDQYICHWLGIDLWSDQMLIAATGVSYNPYGPASIVTYGTDIAKTCTLHSKCNSIVMKLLSPLITAKRRMLNIADNCDPSCAALCCQSMICIRISSHFHTLRLLDYILMEDRKIPITHCRYPGCLYPGDGTVRQGYS